MLGNDIPVSVPGEAIHVLRPWLGMEARAERGQRLGADRGRAWPPECPPRPHDPRRFAGGFAADSPRRAAFDVLRRVPTYTEVPQHRVSAVRRKRVRAGTGGPGRLGRLCGSTVVAGGAAAATSPATRPAAARAAEGRVELVEGSSAGPRTRLDRTLGGPRPRWPRRSVPAEPLAPHDAVFSPIPSGCEGRRHGLAHLRGRGADGRGDGPGDALGERPAPPPRWLTSPSPDHYSPAA